MKELIDKLNFIKIKNFYSSEDNVKRNKTTSHRQEENIYKRHLIKDYKPKYTTLEIQ